MSTVGTIHANLVYGRRIRVLAEHLARVIPGDVSLLDVGCGDGLLTRRICDLRNDVRAEGIDVLVRPETHVAVSKFDGRVIPHPDKSFDAVMFVDALHHTEDPEILLREAARVARRWIVLKDHTKDGFLAGATLRFMDWVGNAHHGVALPYNYWRARQWRECFERLGLKVDRWQARLGLYPFPAALVFGRGLHFIARLEVGASDGPGEGEGAS